MKINGRNASCRTQRGNETLLVDMLREDESRFTNRRDFGAQDLMRPLVVKQGIVAHRRNRLTALSATPAEDFEDLTGAQPFRITSGGHACMVFCLGTGKRSSASS
jgi:hypothetical protein